MLHAPPPRCEYHLQLSINLTTPPPRTPTTGMSCTRRTQLQLNECPVQDKHNLVYIVVWLTKSQWFGDVMGMFLCFFMKYGVCVCVFICLDVCIQPNQCLQPLPLVSNAMTLSSVVCLISRFRVLPFYSCSHLIPCKNKTFLWINESRGSKYVGLCSRYNGAYISLSYAHRPLPIILYTHL